MTLQRDGVVGDADANVAVISGVLNRTANPTQLPGLGMLIHIRYCSISQRLYLQNTTTILLHAQLQPDIVVLQGSHMHCELYITLRNRSFSVLTENTFL